MPGGDQTGPKGQGSATGRAVGYCADFNQPGWMHRAADRGLGRCPGERGGGRAWGGGQGAGWGHRNRFHATGLTGWQRAKMGSPAWGGPGPWPAADADHPVAAHEQELAWLKQQVDQLEQGLGEVRNRIAELSAITTPQVP